jgi:hypothetical protein
MADRKQNVVVRVNPYSSLHIYSDLTVGQVQAVEGVAHTYELNGLIAANVDPRYDVNEVANEIRALAEQQS